MARGGARAHSKVDRVVVPIRPEGLRPASTASLFDDLGTPLFLDDGNKLLWRGPHGTKAAFDAADGRDLTSLFRFITEFRRAHGPYRVRARCSESLPGR